MTYFVIAAFSSMAGLLAPLEAQDITPPKVYTTSPGGVNMSDGSFVGSTTDLSIGSLALERFHIGGLRDPNAMFFGPRMSHNFDIYVHENPKSATRLLPQRMKPIVHLRTSASGTYKREGAVVVESNDDAGMASLAYANGSYTYIAQDGTAYTFDPSITVNGTTSASQRVSTITYSNGRKLVFTYNSSKQPKVIIDNMGYALVFDYANGLTAAVCGFNLAYDFVSVSTTCANSALRATYSYSNDHLASVIDAGGRVTNYTWDGDRIICERPGSAICKVVNVYGASQPWQVTRQTFADGSVWNYAGGSNYLVARNPDALVYDEPNIGASLTDPDSKVTQYGFVQTSPFAITDPLNRVMGFRYSGGRDYEADLEDNPPPSDLHYGSLLLEVIFPEKNRYLAEYNGPFRSITKQSMVSKDGLSSRTLTYNYSSSCTSPQTRQNCTKPLWIRDSKGGQTDFTYADHGGILSELKAAPVTGAARPLKLTTWVSKYAYVKSATGSLVPMLNPIWMIASETVCQTVAGGNAPTCDGAAPRTVTTFEYGPDGTADNLRVHGVVVTAGGTSRRTCFAYDYQGNKISETLPRANLGSCS